MWGDAACSQFLTLRSLHDFRGKEKKKKGFKRVFLKEELKKTSKQIKETHGSRKKMERGRKKKKEKLLQ